MVWDMDTGNARALDVVKRPALLGTYEPMIGGDKRVCKTAFQLLAERAVEYPPEKASEITTIPVEKIVDVARDIDKLDEDLFDSLLARHSSGMRVLSAPLEPSLADEVSTQVVVKSIGMLKRMFDYIVIDTAPFLDEPVLSILERSDVVLLVVDMDLPAVKNAKLALDTLRLIKFPFEKMKLVLNRVNSKARLDIGELERSLGLEVQAAVS